MKAGARYFILEECPGLLTSRWRRDMGVVIGALAERGIASRGVCLMLNTSEFPKTAAQSSLSDVLEMSGGHLQKVLDLAGSGAGILRRAGRGGLSAQEQLTSAGDVCRRGDFGLYDFPMQSQWSPSLSASTST
jgi:hypothetical protein